MTTTDSVNREPGAFDGYDDPLLDRRIASDAYTDVLPERYRFDGAVLSWGGAVEQYLNHRGGEQASVASDESPVSEGTLRRRALQKTAVIHQADREIRDRMAAPCVALLTFAGSFDPTEIPVVDYTAELSDALGSSMDTFRYQTRQKRGWAVEYAVVLGGTDDGVPHYHAVVWIDGVTVQAETARAGLEPVVDRFQSELPATLRESTAGEQRVPDGAIRVDTDPSEGLAPYPADEGGPVHQIARYAGNQVAHLGRASEGLDSFDGLSGAERRLGAVADAVPRGVTQWRSSSQVPAIRQYRG